MPHLKIVESKTGEVTLKSMLANISVENLHRETSWSEPQGKEILAKYD